MHWINNVLKSQPHALFQLKGEKISDLSHYLNWLYLSASCEVIQDILGFRITGNGFRTFSVELGFRISIVSGIQRIPWAVFWIPKPRILDYTSKFSLIPDFENPYSLTWGDILSYATRTLTSRHKKRQPEVDIFSLVLWRLTRKTRTAGVKTKHSDSLCKTDAFLQARYRTSGCYSWRLERQRSRC